MHYVQRRTSRVYMLYTRTTRRRDDADVLLARAPEHRRGLQQQQEKAESARANSLKRRCARAPGMPLTCLFAFCAVGTARGSVENPLEISRSRVCGFLRVDVFGCNEADFLRIIMGFLVLARGK